MRSAPRTTGPALNTARIPADRDQRRARHMAACARLAEFGMDLAEAAHREALRELQPPVERRRAPTLSGLPEQFGLMPPPAFRSDMYGQLFIEISRCVRQAILLEARIDGGAYDHPSPHPSATERAAGHDPAAPSQIRGTSDRTQIAHERVEDDLAADSRRPAPEILAGVEAQLKDAAHTLPSPRPALSAGHRTKPAAPHLPAKPQPRAVPERPPRPHPKPG